MDTVTMQKGEERKDIPYDADEIAKATFAGWRQVKPSPLEQAAPPHPEMASPAEHHD